MPPGKITQWLQDWRSGDARALDRLMPLVYEGPREVARRQLRGNHPRTRCRRRRSSTRCTCASCRSDNSRPTTDHFFAIAGQTMRRILVDHARARMRLKRGGERPASLEACDDDQPSLLEPREVEEVLALDVALERLAKESERAARVIECRIFAGLTLKETAQALGLSDRSVQRTWGAATAWLRKEIGDDRLIGPT